MPAENRKDFNAMLHDSRGMPRIQTVTDPRTIERFGGSRMLLAPPLEYDRIMRTVPYGKVVTVGMIRDRLAKEHGADFTDPMTAGIFVSIAAWASHQRKDDDTPWWRALKAGGELNPKYPGGCEAQKERLESEGHTVVQKGRKNIRWFVQDCEDSLYELRSVRLQREMRAGPQVDEGDPLLPEPPAQLLVVGEDVRVLLLGELDHGVVAGLLRGDDLVLPRQGQSRLRGPVVQMLQLPDQRAGDDDPRLAQKLLQGEVEVYPDLEGHQ